MDSSEQVSQDKMAICRASQEFGVDTPIAPPRTGDEGDETPFSEYSLHFKMAMVPRRGPRGMGGGRLSKDVGFGVWSPSWPLHLACFVDVEVSIATSLTLIRPDLDLQAKSMDIRLIRIL